MLRFLTIKFHLRLYLQYAFENATLACRVTSRLAVDVGGLTAEAELLLVCSVTLPQWQRGLNSHLLYNHCDTLLLLIVSNDCKEPTNLQVLLTAIWEVFV